MVSDPGPPRCIASGVRRLGAMLLEFPAHPSTFILHPCFIRSSLVSDPGPPRCIASGVRRLECARRQSRLPGAVSPHSSPAQIPAWLRAFAGSDARRCVLRIPRSPRLTLPPSSFKRGEQIAAARQTSWGLSTSAELCARISRAGFRPLMSRPVGSHVHTAAPGAQMVLYSPGTKNSTNTMSSLPSFLR